MPDRPRALSPTTAQSLGSLIKSARDIMRKNKGLNGDLDRLPMLTWIMFLKFLDDLELQREEEAKLAGKKFHDPIKVGTLAGILGDVATHFELRRNELVQRIFG